MKLRNLGRVFLALTVSLVLVGAMDSCAYNYDGIAYVIVTGSKYNQIASYEEDYGTGRLTAVSDRPDSSGGQDPIRAVLLTRGRYVYVLNHGTPTVASDGTITWTGGNISLFSISSDGMLSYRSSYPSEGNGSVRLALSAGGNFLYVLDEFEPSGTADTTPASSTQSTASPCYDAAHKVYRSPGDVTVFSIHATTGGLSLVPNQELHNSSGADLNYFPLGCNPVDMYQGAGYLYTAEVSDPTNSSDTSGTGQIIGGGEVVYRYQAATSGQLLAVAGGSQIIGGTVGISVIDGSVSGKYIYLLDAATNSIYPFTPGANGVLSAISGGSIPNAGGAGANLEMDSLTTDSASHYLYIANAASPAMGLPDSAISAFTIDPTNGRLTPMASGTKGVFPTGSGPVCIFEDASQQFIYTADAASSVITGAAFNPYTGFLTNLAAGSIFQTVETPTWCLDIVNPDY